MIEERLRKVGVELPEAAAPAAMYVPVVRTGDLLYISGQGLMVNGASQLLFDAFGEAGRHSRTAVGTNQLPMNIPVEITAVMEVED